MILEWNSHLNDINSIERWYACTLNWYGKKLIFVFHSVCVRYVLYTARMNVCWYFFFFVFIFLLRVLIVHVQAYGIASYVQWDRLITSKPTRDLLASVRFVCRKFSSIKSNWWLTWWNSFFLSNSRKFTLLNVFFFPQDVVWFKYLRPFLSSPPPRQCRFSPPSEYVMFDVVCHHLIS